MPTHNRNNARVISAGLCLWVWMQPALQRCTFPPVPSTGMEENARSNIASQLAFFLRKSRSWLYSTFSSFIFSYILCILFNVLKILLFSHNALSIKFQQYLLLLCSARTGTFNKVKTVDFYYRATYKTFTAGHTHPVNFSTKLNIEIINLRSTTCSSLSSEVCFFDHV